MKPTLGRIVQYGQTAGRIVSGSAKGFAWRT